MDTKHLTLVRGTVSPRVLQKLHGHLGVVDSGIESVSRVSRVHVGDVFGKAAGRAAVIALELTSIGVPAADVEKSSSRGRQLSGLPNRMKSLW